MVDVAAPSTTISSAESAASPAGPAGTHPAAARPADSSTAAVPSAGIAAERTVPCVLMRAGTSRGPFFLREWLPADDIARDEALIGAIGASDLLQVDGVGGGSTLTSKVAIVSKSEQPGCDVDYLFAQVGVGQRSVDTRPELRQHARRRRPLRHRAGTGARRVTAPRRCACSTSTPARAST